MTSYEWEKVGLEIISDDATNMDGNFTSISSDGLTIAIGAIKNSTANLIHNGRVQVYKYINYGWAKLGQDIVGEYDNIQLGCSLSLSDDGTIVAISTKSTATNNGYTVVYKYDGISWNIFGNKIIGNQNGDGYAYCASLSNDGLILAIGSQQYNNNTGRVIIYNYNGYSWQQLGSSIDGDTSGDNHGYSIDLNGDGTIIAIGSPGYDNGYGKVEVYKYNNNWEKIGGFIKGKSVTSACGKNVNLSNDGLVMAFSEPRYDTNAGIVRVYRYIGTIWKQLGEDISGEINFGRSFSLSADGTTIATYIPKHTLFMGIVYVSRYNGTNWIPIGKRLEGVDSGFGTSVNLSADGAFIVISSPFGWPPIGGEAYTAKMPFTTVYKIHDFKLLNMAISEYIENSTTYLNLEISYNIITNIEQSNIYKLGVDVDGILYFFRDTSFQLYGYDTITMSVAKNTINIDFLNNIWRGVSLYRLNTDGSNMCVSNTYNTLTLHDVYINKNIDGTKTGSINIACIYPDCVPSSVSLYNTTSDLYPFINFSVNANSNTAVIGETSSYVIEYPIVLTNNTGRPISNTLNKLDAFLFRLQTWEIIDSIDGFKLNISTLMPSANKQIIINEQIFNKNKFTDENRKKIIACLSYSIFMLKNVVSSIVLQKNDVGSIGINTKDNIIIMKPNNDIPIVLDSLLDNTTCVYLPLDDKGEFNEFVFKNRPYYIKNIDGNILELHDGQNISTYTIPSTLNDTNIYNTYPSNLVLEFGSLMIYIDESHIAFVEQRTVSVNFEVSIDASGNLDVFGQVSEPITNIISAQCKLPVNTLYDHSTHTGLIELWEPANDPDKIHVKLANTNNTYNGGSDMTNAYNIHSKKLSISLEKILCDSFDCSKASPFKYYTDSEYTLQRDFGRVALSCFAHYLFGHVDATSAITNDVSFIQSILSLNKETSANAVVSGNADDRLNTYTSFIDISQNSIDKWNITHNELDANLAKRLVYAIVSKGFVMDNHNNILLKESIVNDPSMSELQKKNELAHIVAQVVGQDASRLMNEDNSERTKDVRIPLRFISGDKIYMNIKLAKPQILVGTGQIFDKLGISNKYNTIENYTLEISLIDTSGSSLE